jgi:hypothetical protein
MKEAEDPPLHAEGLETFFQICQRKIERESIDSTPERLPSQ